MNDPSMGLVGRAGGFLVPPERLTKGPLVLVVEDCSETAWILAEGLRDDEQAFDAIAVSSLSEALDRIAKERVDCVLLDYFLPDGTGLDSLRDLRLMAPGVPVVMMTAAGSEELAVEVMKAGAADYLVKHGAYLSRAIDAVRRAIARRAVECAASRLAQGVFVGRTRELETLRAGVDGALNSRGRLFFLEGQAGIGKTALARNVAAYAAGRGMRVVWGHCHETGGAPAYWPWIRVFRTCMGDAVLDDSWPGLRLDEEDAAEPSSDTAEEPAALLPSQAFEQQPTRFRYFDAIALRLKGSANRQPTLIVLDDLQWADRSSLLLLQFLARELSDSPLLVVCCQRDGDPTTNAATAPLLAELRREAVTLNLRGLSEDEVRALVRAIAEQRAPAACACVPAIVRRTDGNPLFVEEILRHLLDEGIVYHDGEGWRSRIAPENIRLPESVRELSGGRLRYVSSDCREILSVASVVGREFGLDVVAQVSDQSIERVCTVLDEAVKGRIVAPTPGPVAEYVFCQGPVRETLYEELPTLRRAELHERVGEHLERVRAAEVDLYAAELAYHFLHSTNAHSVRKAADFAERAAARAGRLMAHDEAARNYELALQALEATHSSESVQRAELLLNAAESWWRAAEVERARHAASQAAELFRVAGTDSSFARAALLFAGENSAAGTMIGDQATVRLLEEALERLEDKDSGIRARLLARLAQEIALSGDRERRRILGKQAIEMARRLGEPAVVASVLKSIHGVLWRPENFERRLTLADEFVHFASASGNDSMCFDAHLLRAFARLELGNMSAAQKDFSACSQLAAEMKQPYSSWVAATTEVCRAFALGRLDGVEMLVERAFELGEKAQTPHAALFRAVQLAHLCWLQGRFTELGLLWQKLHREQPILLPALECASVLTRCEQGQMEQARAHFERLASDGFGGLPRDQSRVQNLIFLAQACSLLGDAARAAELYALLLPFDGRVVVFAPALLWGAASHFLGLLAAAMGRADLARLHFEDALATNARIGARQWVARTQLAYAELLLASGAEVDRERAEALLEQSVQTSETLRMVGVLRQARAVLSRATADIAVRHQERQGGARERRDESDGARSAVEYPAYKFLCEGSYWTIVRGDERTTLPPMKGLRLLAVLLEEPGREFYVCDLWARIEPLPPELIGKTPSSIGETGTMRPEGGLGPLLDDRARREYQEEMASLQDELEEAERFNDTARASRKREELEVFADQIKGAFNFCGKGYPVADPVERIRQKVRKNIKAAMDAIAAASPCLGRHLETHVKTGSFCSYTTDPEHPIRWNT